MRCAPHARSPVLRERRRQPRAVHRLGGISYAVIKLPRNSVGSQQVRNRALRSVDLAKGVVPTQLRGPRGGQGPTGATGARGPSDVFTAGRTDVALAPSGRTAVDVMTLSVPAGAWWVLGSASAVFNGPGGSDAFRCTLSYGGEAGKVGSVSVVGVPAGAAGAADLVVHEGHVLAGPALIRLRCSHDADQPAGNPHVESAQLSAIRTDKPGDPTGLTHDHIADW